MAKTFNGGIKAGTTAFDAESKHLDDSCKIARDTLAEAFEGVTMMKQLPREDKIDLIGTTGIGFAPDGGYWMKDGKMIAAFEAKKQQNHGNAIERFYKNATIAKTANPDIIYVSFFTGQGAAEGGILHNHSIMASKLFGPNFRFYCKPEGFSYEEIESIMTATINEAMQ